MIAACAQTLLTAALAGSLTMTAAPPAHSQTVRDGVPITSMDLALALMQDIEIEPLDFKLDFSDPPSAGALNLGMLQDTSGSAPTASAGDAAELAKKLSNPIASLISVPVQMNFDRGFGPDGDGWRLATNVQPVIPFSISENWNLISRTIVPIIYQDDLAPGAGDQFGLGDIVQSLFFSPKEPTSNGWIWGAGPVFLIPTATDDLLGSEKFGIGPTAVVLKQEKGWTYGALANHIVSVAGDNDRADVNATFLQPFLSYTTPDAWSFTFNTESTYNWEAEQWSVPINVIVAKLVKIGDQPVQFFAGVRYWAESPDNGPEGFGFRLGFTLLFPTG